MRFGARYATAPDLLEHVRIEQKRSAGAVIKDYRRVSIEEPEIPEEIEHAVGLLVHQNREDVGERRFFVAGRLAWQALRSSRGAAKEAHVIELGTARQLAPAVSSRPTSSRCCVVGPTDWLLVDRSCGWTDRKSHGRRCRVRTGFTPVPLSNDDHSERLDVPFVAVIGLHRSGSSCLAGVLHNLGVHMGEMLTGYEPTGGFEAAELMRICESAYPFPSTEPALPQTTIVVKLEALRRQGFV